MILSFVLLKGANYANSLLRLKMLLVMIKYLEVVNIRHNFVWRMPIISSALRLTAIVFVLISKQWLRASSGLDKQWFGIVTNMIHLILPYAEQENRSLGNSASSDAASTRQRSPAGGSKYRCKKPVPLPRMKAPNKISPEHIHGPIQEDINASSSTPILPHEETAYEPGVEAEEDQDDSGIGHAGDWTSGMMHFLSAPHVWGSIILC